MSSVRRDVGSTGGDGESIAATYTLPKADFSQFFLSRSNYAGRQIPVGLQLGTKYWPRFHCKPLESTEPPVRHFP